PKRTTDDARLVPAKPNPGSKKKKKENRCHLTRNLPSNQSPRRGTDGFGTERMTSVLARSQSLVSVPEILISTAVFCLLLLLFKIRQRIPAGLRKLQGPRGYPLIGNILDLGKNPHLALTGLSQKYGDHAHSPRARPVVVLSGLETIKQALVKQGGDFVGRPDLYSFQFINEGQTFTFGWNSEESWRVRRRLAQSALKTFAGSTSPNSSTCLLEDHISKEAEYLVTKFRDQMKEKESFEPFQYVVISVVNVICAMCFGRRYDHEDQELLKIVDINNDFGMVAPLEIQLISSRSSISSQPQHGGLQRSQPEIQRADEEADITDSLISFCQDKKPNFNANDALNNKNIVGIVNELFGAGFDTVTTALSWCLLYLVTYPEIQKRIQEELAFMYEMFRHSSFIPFTIPHCTTRDTALNGFYIPKDTCVFVNQWQVNHDPRQCIGQNIAKWEVFLFLTTLVQKLEFTLSGTEMMDATPQYGLTMKYKKCEHFRASEEKSRARRRLEPTVPRLPCPSCGDSLGVYQGRVSAVNQASQTISLTRPFHNGVKCLVPEVTFRAGDITELKILEIPGLGDNGRCGDFQHPDLGISALECPGGASQNGTGKLLKKPSSAPQNIPRRTDVKAQEVALSPQLHPCSKSYMDRHLESLNPSKNFRRRHNSWSSSSRHPNQATPKKSGLKNGQMKSKDDECFGDDIEEIPDTDFDFEGNLALFDKAAVFEEIETYERKGGTRSRGTPSEKAAARYRHDENILEFWLGRPQRFTSCSVARSTA
ncbi:hypothetical protein E2320_013338, partial [Naja naja]